MSDMGGGFVGEGVMSVSWEGVLSEKGDEWHGRGCCRRVSAKAGLWTLDWTMDWTMV